MRVMALTFGDAQQGSSLYRVYQFIGPLRARGIELTPIPAATFTAWNDLSSYDAVLLQKRLFSPRIVRRLRRLSRRLIYDVDDAIWHPHGKKHFWLTRWRTCRRLATVTRAADLCLAANSVLVQTLARWNPRSVVLPMALDEAPWFPRKVPAGEPPVRIGWAGHPVNLPYLEAIEPALLGFQQQRRKEVEFVVSCGKRPGFRELQYEYIGFRPGAEPEVIRGFDIGLLPLPDNPFAAGKSPIKALQYMACGVPCVASPVGATCEIFGTPPAALFARTTEEWISVMRQLLDRSLREDMGKRARRTFEEHNALSQVAASFCGLLLSLK